MDSVAPGGVVGDLGGGSVGGGGGGGVGGDGCGGGGCGGSRRKGFTNFASAFGRGSQAFGRGRKAFSRVGGKGLSPVMICFATCRASSNVA